jgi:hypothetical protein
MSPSADLIMVDGHVHFHHGFKADSFLESAHSNFRGAARRMDTDATFVGVLLLTESQGENGFNRLLAQVEQKERKRSGAAAMWTGQTTGEPTSARFTAGNRAPILVVAGRQIPTRERLEVLAVGTRREFEEGQPIRTVIQEVAQAGALPVIPWGAGKWSGKRGRLVDELIKSSTLPPFFLGDSGNRPGFWPRPVQFRRAEEEGLGILSGSDPLPFPGEEKRVGSFGSGLRGAFEALHSDEPALGLKRKLMAPKAPLTTFGEPESSFRFLRNQFKMQLRKLTQ